MPKDPTPENSPAKATPDRRTPGKGAGGRAATPAGRGLGGSSSAKGGRPGGRNGRTRPQQAVVAKPKPWGLIAAAVAVVVFAGAVIGYAVYAVNRSNADRITSADEISGLQTFDYAGQNHTGDPVEYTESPPVGGPHDFEWADCTGTVYDVDIRHENAVHSLEHGATWITYDPATISDADLSTLQDLVTDRNYTMLSPYEGLGSTISLQVWNAQLFVDSASDPRVQQFVDFMTQNPDFYPEVGATCENPTFISDPLVVGDASRSGQAGTTTDAPVSSTPAP